MSVPQRVVTNHELATLMEMAEGRACCATLHVESIHEPAELEAACHADIAGEPQALEPIAWL